MPLLGRLLLYLWHPCIKRGTHNTDNARILGMTRILRCVVIITSLASPIFRPGWYIGLVIKIVQINAVLWGSQLCNRRGSPNDSHRARRQGLCRLRQQWRKQLGEQERPYTVRAQLQLIALLRLRSLRRHHDAGVVPKDIQLPFLREEFVS
jgi:hypothetical protein